MRPLRLVMRAFGPYVSAQTLDFRALGPDALFLIHGPTGAGKTTVLDAMCFALYGETSGGERKGRQMRSDHAEPAVRTEVEFDFAVGERVYRIRRSPDHERPARRGGGTTTEPAAATLWRLSGPAADAREVEVLATKPSEVTARVCSQELLGFDDKRFRQIIVLPQGRFRDLLQADSREREAIMAMLFGTEELEELQDRLKEQAAALRREAEGLAEKRSLLLGQAEVEDEAALAGRRAAVAAELGAVSAQLDGLRTAATAARARLEEGRADRTKLAELAEVGRAVEALAASDGVLRAREEELALARRAAGLEGVRSAREGARDRAAEAAAALREAEERHAAAVEAQRQAVARLNEEEGRKGERDAAAAEVSRLAAVAERLPAYFDACKQLRDAEAARSRAAELDERLRVDLEAHERSRKAAEAAHGAAREASARLDGLRRHARELRRLCERSRELDARRQELAAAERAHQDVANRLAKAESGLRTARLTLEVREAAWRTGQAGVLAAELAPGAPCPVCGSTDHPAPAAWRDDVPGERELDAARAAVRASEAERDDLQDEATRRGAAVARVQATVEQIEAALADGAAIDRADLAVEAERANAALAEAEDAAGRLGALEDRLRQHERRRAELAGRVEEVRAALAKAGEDQAAARAALDGVAAGLPAELCAADGLEAAGRLLAGWRSKAEAAQKRLAEALEAAQLAATEAGKAASAEAGKLEACRRNALEAEHGAGAADADFTRQVVAAGFADVAAYEAARRGAAEIDALEEEVRRERERRSRARDRLERAAAVAEGVSEPDLDELEQTAAAAQVAVEAALRREAELSRLADQLAKLAADLAEVAATLERLRGRYAVLGRVAEVANGGAGNGYRITFRRFVLSALLDEVLDAASQRLRLMSRNRYLLRRAAPGGDRRRHTGLELEVDDTYTGKARAVETLSGGEGFLASLALALGLADVVQTRSGGTRLDTVFIDEGFGSLDPEALDLALRALIDLRSTGRLVGVISHVPELRERIDVRLEVSKGERGSSARFVLP